MIQTTVIIYIKKNTLFKDALQTYLPYLGWLGDFPHATYDLTKNLMEGHFVDDLIYNDEKTSF